jgi:hypothetical protein
MMKDLFTKLIRRAGVACRWVVDAYRIMNEQLQKTRFVLYIARYFVKGRHRPTGEAQYVHEVRAVIVRSASAMRRRNPVMNYLRAHRARRAVAQEPALVAVGRAAVDHCEAPGVEDVSTDPLVTWVAKMMQHNQYYDDIMRGRTTDLMGPIRQRRVLT